MRKRTRAREIALQALYQLDAQGKPGLSTVAAFVHDRAGADPELEMFASRILEGTTGHLEEIDGVIRKATENWDIERMARIDRNILRMAVYEMLHERDIPAKVSINEAIEMGKRFSTAHSGAFINGILARVRREPEL